MKRILNFILLFFFIDIGYTQSKPIHLWKEVEGMEGESTRLYVFPAPDSIATRVGVIVCPGGSYHHLALSHEGFDVAKWLNSQGITAFVLRYRVAFNRYHHPAMIQDLQRAIQYVKNNKDSFSIETLGLMGFSAGGHLATMGGAFHKEDFLKPLGINNTHSLKPDFIVAVYPVISMQDSLAHLRSRTNLLGKKFTKNDIDRFSLELQIPYDMPPVFLIATKDDFIVNYKNSLALKRALLEKNIKHHFQLYKTGGHGFGMNEKKGGEAGKWNILFKEWLIETGFLK